jgi:apolipoprotein N-acyltransferase
MQLVSVTGIYGITFLIAWFAAVINWAWENGFDWPRIRWGVLTYASLLVAIHFFGGVRLLFPPEGSTVRIASLTRPDIPIFATDRASADQRIDHSRDTAGPRSHRLIVKICCDGLPADRRRSQRF